MADFDSSLPVRTQNPGDVIVKVSDATLPSQQLAISAAGEASVAVTQPLPSGSNTIGSVNQGTSPWVTRDQADGPAAPGAAASFSMLTGGQFNTVLPTVTNGQQSALQIDSSARLIISPLTTIQVTNFPATVDVNYGTVGASTIRTASQIGNATGAASFGAGATSAQTLRVEANQGAANATPWNQNIAQIAGSTPSAANSLPIQISYGSSFVSATNPLPVTLEPDDLGVAVANYKAASAIAAGASDNHDYTVTSGKTLNLQSVESSASGKMKALIQIETGVATGVFNAVGAQFNSTATPNCSFKFPDPVKVAAGVRVRVVMSNRDLLAEDLYSTILGFEV